MKIVQMTFSKTWNLGDYNSEKFEVIAGVEETDIPQMAAKDLILFVKSKGTSEVSMGQITKPVEKTEKAAENNVDKTVKTAENKKTKVKAVAETETTKQEANNGNKEKDSEKSSEEIKSEKVVSQKTSEKVKVGKTSPYNPDEPLHKKLVGEFLDKAAPSWRNNTAPYKEVSGIMKAEPFLDGEGLILESFKIQFIENVEAQKN
jgi:hypothetical protein